MLLAGGAHCAFASVPVTVSSHVFRAEVAPSGDYSLQVTAWGWVFRGTMGTAVSDLRSLSGRDARGAYREIRFTYSSSGRREGALRLYEDQPVAECSMRMLSAGANQGAFPDFRSYPENLYRLGFQPVPHALYEFGSLGSEGPWVLFDGERHTLMLSAADHFFVSDMQSDAKLASAITSTIHQLPAGFSHGTILVAGTGINATVDVWGATMQKGAGRRAPSSQADILLRKLSYWTDHGASYFYTFDPQLGYRGTLLAVRKEFDELHVPFGSLQLDSWFYPKGPWADWHRTKWTNAVGGIYRYEADHFLFPDGLSGFSGKLGLPLITHSRWIDRSSPYREEYRMSGDVIVDPRYWDRTAAWLRSSGVAVYEQDWLGRYAKAETNLTDPEAFHDDMARAMQRYGLTMQYCMAAPADFLEGARYNNLTTIRTSHDRFQRSDWDMFLYDSRLATALGIWPWTDVFLSSEEANLAISTLSAGPVGVGDSLAQIDAADLLHAIRGDGAIVKPDVTIRPLDSIYVQDARGASGPMVAESWTDFGNTRIAYVFAYPRHEGTAAEVRPADLGLAGETYFYDWKAGSGQTIAPGGAGELPFQDGWGYAVVSPVGPSGMALIGDPEQFATAGRMRIAALRDDGTLHFTVAFAPGESSRTVALYSPRKPRAESSGGDVQASYDQQNHLAFLTIHARRGLTVPVEVRMGEASAADRGIDKGRGR
ncbi:MAG TPA: hypothetical protein VHX37_08620 [Acidobacteriaceae bacterium]|nr:hypothetical protein [Acidobacteriaceae bacterium]